MNTDPDPGVPMSEGDYDRHIEPLFTIVTDAARRALDYDKFMLTFTTFYFGAVWCLYENLAPQEGHYSDLFRRITTEVMKVVDANVPAANILGKLGQKLAETTRTILVQHARHEDRRARLAEAATATFPKQIPGSR